MSDPGAVLVEFYSRWSCAHADHDVDGLVSLYTADALFFGSTPSLRVGPDAIRDYFNALAPQPQPEVGFEVLHATSPTPDLVVGAAVGTFRWTGTPGVAIRFTHTLVRVEGTWLACVHHASPA